MDIKRERSCNFTPGETRLLIKSALEFKYILENKQTDHVTCKDKQQAWENVAVIFNASTTGVNRCSKTLKLKYDSLKKNLRKKLGEQKKQMYMTGGGSCPDIQLTDYEEELMPILKLNVEGLPARADNDHIAGQALQNIDTNNNSDHVNRSELEYAEVLFDADIDSSKEIVADIQVLNIDLDDEVQNTNEKEKSSKLQPSASSPKIIDAKWSKWNTQKLKMKKSQVLYTNKKENSTIKFNNLADVKCELAMLQMEVLNADHKNKLLNAERESEKQKEDMEFKNKENDLRIQILKKELEEEEQIIIRRNEEHTLKMKLLEQELKFKEVELFKRHNI